MSEKQETADRELLLRLVVRSDPHGAERALADDLAGTSHDNLSEPVRARGSAVTRPSRSLVRTVDGEHLRRARSRRYRSQILQVNMRLKALAEIYTMHSFAPLWSKGVQYSRHSREHRKET